MKVQLTVIEQLGMRMYAHLPPVLSELIANSWDADANKVELSIPESDVTSDYGISVKDDGVGMSFEELDQCYLAIGRNRRRAEGKEKTPNGRLIMGRKGIGKLSAFGIARVIEIESTKSGLTNHFSMDLDGILKAASEGALAEYHPDILATDEELGKNNGTTVMMKKLARKTSIAIPELKANLARRFSVISPEFQVFINDSLITPEDRGMMNKVESYWQVVEDVSSASPPQDERFKRFVDGTISPSETTNWKISGWIGTMPKPTIGSLDSGIILMARGKLIHEPSFYEVTGGKEFAYAYMLGELNAEYFDAIEDLVSAHRGNVVWESEEGQATKKWLRDTITRISEEWASDRRRRREENIRKDPDTAEWLSVLNQEEKKTAEKIIKIITNSEVGSESQNELMKFVRQSFEFQVFKNLVDDVENDADPIAVLRIFKEWNVIEARDVLHIAEGRLKTIEKLDLLVRSSAREVPDIHNFLSESPWILDPTWTKVEEEIYFSELLKRNYPNEMLKEDNRRIDFACFGVGNILNVYELKRPSHHLDSPDMVQIETYMDFIRGQLGSASRSYSQAVGYIVVGAIKESASLLKRIDRDQTDRIYVLRYSDLLRSAKLLHRDFSKRLRKLDPAWRL